MSKRPGRSRQRTTRGARRPAAKAPGKASRPRAKARRPAAKAATKAGRPAAKTKGARRATAKKPTTRVAATGRAKGATPKGRTLRSSAGPRKRLRKAPQLDRERRTLEDTIPTPPSSLDMDRRGSAVRTGRAEMAQLRRNLGAMTPLTGGDVDANAEEAYFSGEGAPGGDNPTPDQDVVDEIGRAMGMEYQDNEELQGANKLEERDRHRWELDPASSEDYRNRK